MAVAAGGREHRHAGVLQQEVLELLAAARDDHVAGVGLGHEGGQLVAVGGERLDGVARAARPRRGRRARPRAGRRSCGRRSTSRAGDGVAGLQAQRGDVDGDVRARLVDDRAARPSGTRTFCTSSPFGQPPAGHDLADRVGQRRPRRARPRPAPPTRSGSSVRRSSSASLGAGRRAPPRRPRRWPRGSTSARPRAARRSPRARRPLRRGSRVGQRAGGARRARGRRSGDARSSPCRTR